MFFRQDWAQVGVPSHSNAGAERMVERVELIARVSGNIADQGKADLRIEHLPLECRSLALSSSTIQCPSRGRSGPTNMTCFPVSSFGGISSAQPSPYVTVRDGLICQVSLK